MSQLGARPRTPLPEDYQGYQFLRSHGRIFAIPRSMDPEEACWRGLLTTHPAILSAATQEELQARIDAGEGRAHEAALIGQHEGYKLFRHRGRVYAIPEAAGALDLNLEETRRRAGVFAGKTAEEVRAQIRASLNTIPVEFAGWLPVFENWGNCGRHPQFGHTTAPPSGFRFTCSAPPPRPLSRWRRAVSRVALKLGYAARKAGKSLRPLVGIFRGGVRVGLGTRLRMLGTICGLYFKLRRKGARLIPLLGFLRTRHYQSQLLLAKHPGLVFLTSMPYTYGQNPWVIEIEDITTLFYPFHQNGHTCGLHLRASPYFPIVKAFLEAEHCRCILTHMQSTARMIPTLFGSEAIRAKVHYAPLGVKVPERCQRHDDSDLIHLVFINSWCQVPENFFVRGGLDVLEAFDILHERYPQLRLTMRTNLPPLDPHYHRIIERNWVRVIHRFVDAAEMHDLLADSHVFLLPAARIHVVSLLQAMSYGLAVVASDGWGIEEYVKHEHNGLIVKGRYGKVSWADEQEGMLREDYAPMWTPDPEVVAGIVEAVSRLVEDRELRRRLGRASRRDVETTYNLEQWNRGLKEMLDKAHLPGPVMATVPGTATEEVDLHHAEVDGTPAQVR
jgi:glycosyltransferase involved in cell wall biosynthesis